MKPLTTGGTGALGRELVRLAEGAGHVVRVASRRARPPGAREWAPVDLGTGQGVAAAVAGCDAVVHAATDPRRPEGGDVRGTARLVDAARAVVLPLPTAFRVQSVAASEVAGRLPRCITDGPGGRLPNSGGPEVLTLGEAARAWREVRGVRKPVVRLPIPGHTAAAFRAGENTAPSTWRTSRLVGSRPATGGWTCPRCLPRPRAPAF